MKLAIFDFDGTLFPKETLPFLLMQWKKLHYSKSKYIKTYVSLITLYIKYKLGIESKFSREQMKLMAVGKFNKIFEDLTEQEIKEYFDKSAKALEGLLNKSVVSEVEAAREDGYHTVLLSGSYEYLLNNIGDYLKFDTVIGTKVYFNKNLYDSSKEPEIYSGESKLKKIYKEFKSIDWEASRAYADSYSDIYLLQSVGQPVAVNPDTKLKTIAIELDWRIIS
ncbi:MAG: HAD family hydrolase [Eubacteriales bacterium]